MHPNVLLICGSMKPAPGKEGKSAARELLKVVERGILESGEVTVKLLDLRDLNLPFFDGRHAQDYEHNGVNQLVAELQSAKHIIVSAPAYWRTIVGGMINAFNVFAGPLYDFPEHTDIFRGKKFYSLIVGAEIADAVHGASQMRNLLSSLGGTVYPKDILVGNIRHMGNNERAELAKKLYDLGKRVVMEIEQEQKVNA
ncbi:NAD(P)H-dependent oxidoreductase [Brevibacillus sp. GCM10020057]|uniref:NAD(P)H-dependent oxidoreductase n=1 Tax=Brevibacillus sp. GCM10020057 TaxID=3317327 RepID=UPI00362D6C40